MPASSLSPLHTHRTHFVEFALSSVSYSLTGLVSLFARAPCVHGSAHGRAHLCALGCLAQHFIAAPRGSSIREKTRSSSDDPEGSLFHLGLLLLPSLGCRRRLAGETRVCPFSSCRRIPFPVYGCGLPKRVRCCRSAGMRDQRKQTSRCTWRALLWKCSCPQNCLTIAPSPLRCSFERVRGRGIRKTLAILPRPSAVFFARALGRRPATPYFSRAHGSAFFFFFFCPALVSTFRAPAFHLHARRFKPFVFLSCCFHIAPSAPARGPAGGEIVFFNWAGKDTRHEMKSRTLSSGM